MEEQSNESVAKGGFSKRLITTIVIVLLIIGGTVAAYVSLNKSTKEKYFQAEKDTGAFIKDKVGERFESLTDWIAFTRENPTETTIEVSAEYNDPFNSSNLGMISPEQIINGSTLQFITQTDIEKKQLATEVSANVAGLEIDDINFYLTEEKIMLRLPFLNELLLVRGEDLGELLQSIDPEFSLSEEIDLGELFDRTNPFLSEEDMEYFQKEYLTMIYDELPDEAFTSENEKVDVEGESMNAEKITFHLEELEIKDLLTSVFDKLHKDERVKEILEDKVFNLGVDVAPTTNEIEIFMDEIEEGLKYAKDEIQHFHFPDGLTSTIWVEKKSIVKRDFEINMGPSEDELVTLAMNGTQLLGDTNQVLNYDFTFKDPYDEGTLNFTADLLWEDDKIVDTIKLVSDGVELTYEADETLQKGQRDFDRTFSMTDPYSGGGGIIWSGTSSYEKDNMSSEHTISVETEDVDQDLFYLQLAIDGKKIKSVDIPEENNIMDFGNMTEEEIMNYIEYDAAEQFQQWFINTMGLGGGLGF